MASYRLQNCDTEEVMTVNCADPLGTTTVHRFVEHPNECWMVTGYVASNPSYPTVTIDLQFKDCEECLSSLPVDTDCDVITEDDINVTLKKVMVQNEPLLSIRSSIVIKNGNQEHVLFSYFIPLPQNYIGGYLDYNDSIQMDWFYQFPLNAVNNKAEIITIGSDLTVILPSLINWRDFQTLPSLTSIFGVDATNNWLWYQANGWTVSQKIETQNDKGVYVDEVDLVIRDYNDNNLIDWTWEFYRTSDNLQVSAPISNEPTRVVAIGNMPTNLSTPIDYATLTVESAGSTNRYLISTVYDQLGQSNSPLQPLVAETKLKITQVSTPNHSFVLECIFDPAKINANEVKFTARSYSGNYSERNFVTYPLPKLPEGKLENEYKSKCCDCLPELKLASKTSENTLHNDITGVVHKNQTSTDTCEFKIYKDGNLLTNVGLDYANGFPFDPNVSAFIYNWKHYIVNHGAGCYRIEKEYTIAGIPLTEEVGHYDLKEYTPDNAMGTVRALYQNNFETLWEETTINYTDSGFEDSYRFRGMFGQWQPNVFSESNFSVLNENRVASIKSKDTYILNHFKATECHINRLHKIVMHAAIWRMSDHNPSNTLQEQKIYECVLDNENREEIKYNVGSRVTGIEIILSKRQQNSVSLFGGSVQVPQGATWLLPTVVGGGSGTCPDATVQNATTSPTYTATIPSGGTLVLPQDQYNIYVNGVLQESFTTPAIEDLTININI